MSPYQRESCGVGLQRPGGADPWRCGFLPPYETTRAPSAPGALVGLGILAAHLRRRRLGLGGDVPSAGQALHITARSSHAIHSDARTARGGGALRKPPGSGGARRSSLETSASPPDCADHTPGIVCASDSRNEANEMSATDGGPTGRPRRRPGSGAVVAADEKQERAAHPR